MARPVTVGRTSVAPCGKTIWGISMTTDNPLISIYMPTWNRQQLAIRAIKSVLRQDYRHWEMIIVDDCSSSYQQLQQFVEELNDPRVRYTHNARNTGACAVRNQAIMQAQGHYITGIDDDDEWTPNRLSVFLAHKHQLTTHAFLYANDYVCEGEVYSQPASLPLYPKSPYSRRLFYKRNIIGNQVFTWAWRFKSVFVRYRTQGGAGLRHFSAHGGGVWRTVESRRGDANFTYQPRRDADYLFAEKVLRLFPFLS